MRGIARVGRRGPKDLKRRKLCRPWDASEGVSKPWRGPASPAACFLPDATQGRSLGVSIIKIWYHCNRPSEFPVSRTFSGCADLSACAPPSGKVSRLASLSLELTSRRYRAGGALMPKVLDIDPFHGREFCLWVGAARSAIPELSGKRRNDTRGEIRPTGGRPQRPSRRVTARLWCTTPRRETAPSETAFAGGEMRQYQGPLV